MADARPRVGVGVFVRSASHPGCILLGQRRASHGAGTHALPGGHLEHGESWAACAAREVLEETGLALTNLRHATVINSVDRPSAYHYVVILMTADAPPGAEPRNLEPDKCAGWAWHRWSEPLPAPVFRPLADVRAYGFDPFAGADDARLLHAPDDSLPPYCCAILREPGDAVFMERRSADAKVAGGHLTCFGGKRDGDESPLDCIARELTEELGEAWARPAASRKRSRPAFAASGAAAEVERALQFRRAVDLYVDGKLIAWFFEAEAPARDAPLTFEAGRTGVWITAAELEERLGHGDRSSEAPLSPWHACVLRAWRNGERRADFITLKSDPN
jgi:8-oxo-dGTP diphosphatase